MIELMISARLRLILHKYAGIYMGASAQGGRTLASEKFGTGLPGWSGLVRQSWLGQSWLGQSWSGLGWLGQSWPRQLGRARGLSPGIRRKQFLPPAQCAAQTENSAHEKSRQNSARQIANASTFFFLLFFF